MGIENRSIRIDYNSVCADSITQEMIAPEQFQLTLSRKEIDFKEFEFERKITELLAPERLSKREVFDSKHYLPVYSFDN